MPASILLIGLKEEQPPTRKGVERKKRLADTPSASHHNKLWWFVCRLPEPLQFIDAVDQVHGPRVAPLGEL